MSRTIAVEPKLRLRDNPLLVAQARRRMRRRQAIPTLLIAGTLGLCGLLFVSVAPTGTAQAASGLVDAIFIGIGLVLFFRGTIQVASNISHERTTGILDFHRATPTTPLTDAIGYLLGSPAREYMATAALLPFLVLAALMGGENLIVLICSLLVIVTSAWLFHAFALVLGLSATHRRGVTGGSVLGVVMLLGIALPMYAAGFVTPAYLTPFPAISSMRGIMGEHPITGSMSFFGLSLHPVLYTAIVQGYLLSFLLWASARKLRRDGAPAFSRPGSFAFFSIAVILLLGGSWTQLRGGSMLAGEDAAAVAGSVYFFGAVGLASLLVTGLVPSYLDLVRALRRARRAGREAPSWLEDGATAWPLAFVFTGLITVGYLLLGAAVGPRLPSSALFCPEALMALVAACAFLACLSGASEYVRLALRGSYKSGSLLIAFMLLVLPFILSGIVASAAGSGPAPLYVAALSPIFGLGGSVIRMSSAWAQEHNTVEIGQIGFSLAVTVCLAAWFHFRCATIRGELTRTIPLGGKPATDVAKADR